MKQMLQTDKFVNILHRISDKLIFYSDDLYEDKDILDGYLQEVEWAYYAHLRLKGFSHLLPTIDSISMCQDIRYPVIVQNVLSQCIPSIKDIENELYDIIPTPCEIEPYLRIFKQKIGEIEIPKIDGINDERLITFGDIMYGENVYMQSIRGACRDERISRYDAEYLSLKLSQLFSGLYWLRANIRVIVANFDQMAGKSVANLSKGRCLPDKLNTDRAKAYLDKAVEFGFISLGYTEWLGTMKQLAFFCEEFPNAMGWKREKYITFEAWFNKKHLAKYRKESVDADGVVKDQVEIMSIFN